MKKISKEFCYKKNHIQQLRGFVNTVKFGSPSKAAKHAGLVYATLTMQIQALEKELNTSLFHKRRANFMLTKDGQRLYEMSVPIIQALESIYDNFFMVKNRKKSQQLNIAGDNFVASYLLPNIVKKFQDKFPEIQLNLNNLDNKEIISALISDQIDCAIITSEDNYPELEFLPVTTCNLGIMLDKAHPLTTKEEISLQDLKNTKNLIAQSNISDIIIAELKKYNINKNITFKNYSPTILALWVKSQAGIALASDLEAKKTGLSFRLIKELKTNISYGIIFKKGKYLADNIKNFINIINQETFLNR